MSSAELLRRLSALEQVARRESLQGEAKRLLGFERPSPTKEQRLLLLWNEIEGPLSAAEVRQLYSLLEECVILSAEDEEHPTVLELPKDIRALIIAFHRFSRVYPSVSTPKHCYILQKYPLNTVRRLFEKYGWTKGQPDCASILPLEEWAPDDRRMLLELYRP